MIARKGERTRTSKNHRMHQNSALSTHTRRLAELAGPARYEALDGTHRDAGQMLEVFGRLLAHLQVQGLDIEAERAAAEVLDFFDGPAAYHHRDEEALLFPPLLAGGDAALVLQVQRLQQEHGWITEDWRRLKPQLEAVVAGFKGYDLAMLCAALPGFAELHHGHVALEEQVVYPAARAMSRAALD